MGRGAIFLCEMIIDSLEFAIIAQSLASLCPLPLMVTSYNVKSKPEDDIGKTVGTKLQPLFDLQNVHEASYKKKKFAFTFTGPCLWAVQLSRSMK